ncbi:hypothetical protein I601_1854 [Nocardioides dokdonensis FR1436]|uniref:Peptidase C39-like domain-containing protein n=1 Tax=Nocardioides dokdonensis FR1436 TaxID=1300347 RepID=A0A1A9GLF9_9ACTN|nr:hypothetical protein I601_1854 [Nocardioides dokdonensis FR1436]
MTRVTYRDLVLRQVLPAAALALVATALSPAPTSYAADGGAQPPAARSASATGTAGRADVAARRGTTRKINHQAWDGSAQLKKGRFAAARVKRGRVFAQPAASTRSRALDGTSYTTSRWDGPWHRPGFSFTELIASWEAKTPGDSWIEVEVKGRAADGRRSSWDLMGRWASGDKYVERTTVSGQDDDLASVNVDTWRAPAGLVAYRLRVTLGRKAGASTKPPSLGMVGAMASRLPSGSVSASKPGVVSNAGGKVLAVPTYSQMIHQGHYAKWGNGGEAWCSPTSTSMVLGYYDALPSAKDRGWVPEGHPDPWVDHAARMTYDHGYDGTGNWPFNTAYAARQTGAAFVTRLRSMREVEQLVAADIPVVVSIAFGRGEISGTPISASNGHLLVVVGFTRDGDVVVNDPAGANNGAVRRTYDRGQLENAWLPRSGGTAYVITDADHPLPAPEKHSNW